MSPLTRWQRDAVALCERAPNAQTIVVGAVTTTGPVSIEDRVVLDPAGGERLERVTIATVPVSDFATVPARHTSGTIGGATRILRDVRAIDDGLLYELWFAEG